MRNRLGGLLSTLLNSFLRGGSNEFVTYFALRIQLWGRRTIFLTYFINEPRGQLLKSIWGCWPPSAPPCFSSLTVPMRPPFQALCIPRDACTSSVCTRGGHQLCTQSRAPDYYESQGRQTDRCKRVGI